MKRKLNYIEDKDLDGMLNHICYTIAKYNFILDNTGLKEGIDYSNKEKYKMIRTTLGFVKTYYTRKQLVDKYNDIIKYVI